MWIGLNKKPNHSQPTRIRRATLKGVALLPFQVPSGRPCVLCLPRDGIVRGLGGKSPSSTIPSKEALPHGINGQLSLDP